MKSTDKFLISIVIGIMLLVVVAFGIAFLRPEPTYQSEDTPEGVVHNYLMALQREEYYRAYSYLSPVIPGYPDSIETFVEDIHDNAFMFRLDEETVSLEVISEDIRGNTANVNVQETHFYQGSLFDSGEYKSAFEFRLRQEKSSKEWKIHDGDTYWAWCWNDDSCH